MGALQELFDLVRESAERSAWTRGVELARSGAVLAEPGADDERVVRVRGGGVVHPTVVLYPEDEAWECDCGSPDDPCEHVAAAIIAVRRAEREGVPLPTAAGSGSVGYRFTSTNDGLALERVAVSAGEETELRTTLTALASGRVTGPDVVATQADLAAERALGPRLRGPLPRGVLRTLLRPLSSCPDVTLDGEPIAVSPEPVMPRARLVDESGSLRLRVELHPPVERHIPGGFGLCAGTLREVAPSRLSGRELEDLGGAGRLFSPDEIPALLSELLPDLEARIEVLRETDKATSTTREPPRIEVHVDEDEEGISVLPTLVYGDPPIARVDAGRLTHIQGPVPVRDEEAERRLTRDLQTRVGLVPGRRMAVHGDAALELVERLQGMGTLRGEGHHRFFRAPDLEPRIALEGERLSVRFETRGPVSEGSGTGQADAEAVLSAWRRGDSFVALQGGGFAPLPADWVARYGERLADLLSARDAEGQVARSALPALARLCDDLDLPRPELGALERLVAEGASEEPAPLPADLQAELRAYQRRGVDWLRFLGDAELGALLADDMGLGKTLQALCALEPPALVVAPTSVLGNWAAELSRFRPALAVDLHHGQDRRLDPDADVTLTSYALLRRDREILAEVDWATFVLDEAQTIKNPDSQVADAARALRARRRIALTGTPVENRLEELWSQMQVLNPGLLGSRADFEARTAAPIRRGEEEAVTRLRERIGPFLLRRRKAEVAPELPARTETVLRVELSENERTVYDTIRAATLRDVVEKLESGGNVMAALEALLRLRQACCDVTLVPGQPDPGEPSSKRALLRDRLETARAEGHKSLVFSQWTALLDRIEPDLKEAGLDFVRLDGSTRDRSAAVERFQSEDGPPVFLISLKAGGTGLNLTAADHVFLVDPWWNPAVEDQAADRAHRIGQDRPVFVHRLAARNTVEERILALQTQKRAMAEAALGGAPTAGSLSRAELLELLQG
ncbi:MAG: SNF2-related protein [Myxococcota bacterium]|nr:SNF2-related protein [Myxococcota bacterium]